MAYGKTKRDRVEQERTGGTGFWKPASGENRIRIMPAWDEATDAFWFRTGTHFNVGPDEKPVPCPEESGVADTCFLCRKSKQLSKGDEDERDEGEAIGCRPGFLMSIVDYAHAEDGVQVWRCGITAYRQIRKLWLNDDEYGDMTDLADGYDILVGRAGEGINTKYDITPARQNSRFPSKKLLDHSSETVAALYQSIADEVFELPNLAEIQTFSDDEEMEGIYKGTSGRRQATEAAEDQPKRSAAQPAAEAVPAAEDAPPPARRRARVAEDDPPAAAAPANDDPPPVAEPRRASRRTHEDDNGGDEPQTSGSSRVRARVRD
jgi:hypothetical protein